MSRKHKAHGSLGDRAAGNGILNRRVFLENTLIAGAVGAVGGSSGAQAQPLVDARWMKEPGAGFIPYGQPSRFESKVVRVIPASANPATPGIGTARTPHHLLNGIITPNGLHFDRSHSGTPDIDPDQHRLLIHGLVKRPLDPRRLLGCVVELVLREDDVAAPVPRHSTAAELGIAAARLACLYNRHSVAAAAGAARLAHDLKRQIGEVRSTCHGLAGAAGGFAVEGCAG